MAHFVSQIMTTSVETIEIDAPLEEARERMIRGGFRHIPVVSNERLVGVISEHDVAGVARTLVELDAGREVYERFFAQPCGNVLKARYLSGDILTLMPSDTVEEAARLMVAQRLSALPVVRGDRVVGILSYIDILDDMVNARGALRTTRAPQDRSRVAGAVA